MKKLTTIFGEHVESEEAATYWDNRKDYEVMFWRSLNAIADEAAQIETDNMDIPLSDVMSDRKADPLKVERAWLLLAWHGLFSPLTRELHSYYLSTSRILDIVSDNPRTLYLYSTYIVRKPNPAVYIKLLGTPFADQYRNHAMFYSLITTEDHSAYATFAFAKPTINLNKALHVESAH